MNLKLSAKNGHHRPVGYRKIYIDGKVKNTDHNGHQQGSPPPTGFLSQSKGTKKTSQGAPATRCKGDTRPPALERRRPQGLPAETEAQLRELQALTRSLIESREQEHQDISRELHDNIAQVLSAATARIALTQDEPIPVWLRQELLALRDHLKAALADVRTLARDLRPSVFDHHGFAATLEKHAEAFRERTRISLEVTVAPQALSFLGNDGLTHLFRLTQESLQNIEEHSGANRAWIRLRQNDGALHLEIGDDGCGFTADRVTEAQQDGHLGLLGMRERAELLGGRLHCEATPGKGTTIRVMVPPPRNPRDTNALEQPS
jgi:signal transduction histidine kinase